MTDQKEVILKAIIYEIGISTGCLGIIAAIISITSVACWIICMIV